MSKPYILLSIVTIVTVVLVLWFRLGASETDTLTPVGFFGPFKRKKAKTAAKDAKLVSKMHTPNDASSVKLVSKMPAPNDGARNITSSVKGLIPKTPNPGEGRRKCSGCRCKIEDEALGKMTGKEIMGVSLSHVFGSTPSSCVCTTCD